MKHELVAAAIKPRPDAASEALRESLAHWRIWLATRIGYSHLPELQATHGTDVIDYEEHLAEGGKP